MVKVRILPPQPKCPSKIAAKITWTGLMLFLIPIPPSERSVFPNDTVSTTGRRRHESQRKVSTYRMPKISCNPARKVSVSLSGFSFRAPAIRAASRIVSVTFSKSVPATLSSSAILHGCRFGATSFRKSFCNSSSVSEKTSMVSCMCRQRITGPRSGRLHCYKPVRGAA